jgi:SAM-dependent methyltransferase
MDHKAATSWVPAVDKKVVWDKAAGDYAAHRAGFPERFFDRLEGHIGLSPGQSALDIGTGTGTVARGLARRGLAVQAIDPSADMMAQARALDGATGVEIGYAVAKAEALPFVDGSFDLVTAGQCWHWFDRPVAAAEIHRVLKPGGRLVIAHFDWLPWPGNVVEATEALILAHNPHWRGSGGMGMYPTWLGDMSGAGFVELETASFDMDQPYSHEGWRGRIRASAGVKGSLDAEAVARFDVEHQAMLAARFRADPLAIPHRIWWVTGCKSELNLA